MDSAPPSAVAGSSHAAQEAAFADDPRVYFNKSTATWRYETNDGAEMEYDNAKASWIPLVDEDLLKQQQAAYSIAGVDESTPAAPVLARENKKRKEPDTAVSSNYNRSGTGGSHATKRGRNDKKDKPPTERKSKNTAVYVTGIPIDAQFDEIVDRFSKCGVIEEDDEGEPKVKMYAKDDGTFSGEALVVYFKEDSVLLAINILDEAELRIGESSSVMHVSKADFTHKSTGDGGEGHQRKVVDKKKASRRIGKMQKKLQEWDDEDGFGPSIDLQDQQGAANKNSRAVVLKHMFTLQQLEEDASLLLDLKEDVREECATLGEVTNVVLYDLEKEGIMSVKFRDVVSAEACVLKMNGRYFDGRKVEAFLYSGKQRFRRSGHGDEFDGNMDEAEKKRLDDFAQWLMEEDR